MKHLFSNIFSFIQKKGNQLNVKNTYNMEFIINVILYIFPHVLKLKNQKITYYRPKKFKKIADNKVQIELKIA